MARNQEWESRVRVSAKVEAEAEPEAKFWDPVDTVCVCGDVGVGEGVDKGGRAGSEPVRPRNRPGGAPCDGAPSGGEEEEGESPSSPRS